MGKKGFALNKKKIKKNGWVKNLAGKKLSFHYVAKMSSSFGGYLP